jgi:hypothetical protein
VLLVMNCNWPGSKWHTWAGIRGISGDVQRTAGLAMRQPAEIRWPPCSLFLFAAYSTYETCLLRDALYWTDA